MTREQLMGMKVDELRKLASEHGVKKIRSYKKNELIDVILSVLSNSTTEAKEETNIVNTDDSENKEVGKKTKQYIENAPLGTIVAFTLPNGKVKSAAIINRSSKSQKLKVETSYGKQYIVPYDDVLWVKTANRWPKGIYQKFKSEVEKE